MRLVIIEGMSKQSHYKAIIKQDGDWWIGWIQEISGVNCQEATREELIETLRVSLSEMLELNRSQAVSSAGGGSFEEVEIVV